MCDPSTEQVFRSYEVKFDIAIAEILDVLRIAELVVLPINSSIPFPLRLGRQTA